MLIDKLMNVIFGFINFILSPLGLVNFDFDVTKLEPILQYIKMAMYIIPIKELMPILVFIMAMMALRISVALIRTIWDLLPLL